MKTLFPEIEPMRVHEVARDGGHRLYVEECGRPDGAPVLFLHGGPGSGCTPAHRRFFDPAHYRILLIDQRGSGRSTPLGETACNATPLLIEDLEAIRAMLGIERWLLFGGSWGATLALAYALAHPDRVAAMVLRGTFLARSRDLEWFFGPDGAARLFPRDWAQFSALMPGRGWQALVRAYHRQLQSDDPHLAHAAARRWSLWGARLVTWTSPAAPGPPGRDSSECSASAALSRLAKARIEAHYAEHRYFMPAGVILRSADRLPAAPITLIHGQRDLVCPVESAYALHRVLPQSRLAVLPHAGHLMWEPAMVDALVSETERLRALSI